MTRFPKPRLCVAALAFAATGIGAIATPGGVAVAQDHVPGCRTGQLAVWRADPGDAALGSVYYDLEFSNTSHATCSLEGYPHVAAVDANGHQLGAAAMRNKRFTPSRVVLTPGATAHAILQVIDVGTFPVSACDSASAFALRIRPPGTEAARMLDFSFGACRSGETAFLSVRAVRPGTGIPGYSQ